MDVVVAGGVDDFEMTLELANAYTNTRTDLPQLTAADYDDTFRNGQGKIVSFVRDLGNATSAKVVVEYRSGAPPEIRAEITAKAPPLEAIEDYLMELDPPAQPC